MASQATTQADKLRALIAAANRALPYAEADELFASKAGMALCNAAYDVFEVDGLFDLSIQVERELPAEPAIPDLPIITLRPVTLDPSVWGDAA